MPSSNSLRAEALTLCNEIEQCLGVKTTVISGSFGLGAMHRSSDLDIVVLYQPSVAPIAQVCSGLFRVLPSTAKTQIAYCNWYGVPREMGTIVVPPPWRGFSCTVELHLTYSPFVLCSQYWDQIFSPEEIAFEAYVRERAGSALSEPGFNIFKQLLIREAAWRIVGAVSIHCVDSHQIIHPRLEMAKMITPQLLPAPDPCGISVDSWFKRTDRDSPGIYRPLTIYQPELLEQLEIDLDTGLAPNAPPWTEVIGQIQVEAIRG